MYAASPIENESRWNLVPDGDGKLHVVDINPVNEEPDVEPIWNPETDTRFMLFTRNNPTSGQQVTWTTQSIQNSHFNSAHPVRMFKLKFKVTLTTILNVLNIKYKGSSPYPWLELRSFFWDEYGTYSFLSPVGKLQRHSSKFL